MRVSFHPVKVGRGWSRGGGLSSDPELKSAILRNLGCHVALRVALDLRYVHDDA